MKGPLQRFTEIFAAALCARERTEKKMWKFGAIFDRVSVSIIFRWWKKRAGEDVAVSGASIDNGRENSGNYIFFSVAYVAKGTKA